MGKSRKLRQNKKNGRKSFRNLMNKSRKMMMTPFKNRFTRKMFGGANKKWVVTLVKNEEPDSTPIVTKISVGSENSDDDHMEHLTLVDQKWVMLNKETTVVQDTPVTYAEPDTTQNTSVTVTEPDTTHDTNTTPVTKSVTDPHTQFYSNKTRQNSPRKRTSKKIHPSDWRYSRMTKNPMHT